MRSIVEKFVEIIQRGDLVAAQQLFQEQRGQVPQNIVRDLGVFFYEHHDYVLAARMFNRVSTRDPEIEILRNFALNMNVLREKRPELYEVMLKTEMSADYKLCGSKDGFLSYQFMYEGAWKYASYQNDVSESMRQLVAVYDEHYKDAKKVCLHGCGAGYFIQYVAENPHPLLLHQEQRVHVYEPDAACFKMMLHCQSYFKPGSPLHQDRFYFFVGANWAEQYARVLDENCWVSPDKVEMDMSVHGDLIRSRKGLIVKEHVLKAKQKGASVQSYYQSLNEEHWHEIFSDDPPRPPRILFITSQFTTVLKYSTWDSEAGFQAAGCETRCLIEPTDHDHFNMNVLVHVLNDFKPDMIFVIDHLRHEYNDVIPPELPMVCWIQDNLPNLANSDAGLSINRRDFVIGSWLEKYVDDYDYPIEQCLIIPRYGSPPNINLNSLSDYPEVCYISNWGESVEDYIDSTLQLIQAGTHLYDQVREMLPCIAREYEAGRSLLDAHDVYRFIQNSGFNDENINLHKLSDFLNNQFNQVLYRQQGLRWAAQCCAELGLSLGIYGKYWEQNKEFSKWALGHIDYTTQVPAVMNQAKFNLKLEFFSSLCHQRMVDGLFSHGFVLSRQNYFHSNVRQLHRLLDKYEADTESALINCMTEGDRQLWVESMQYVSDHLTVEHSYEQLMNDRQFEGRAFKHSTPPFYSDCMFEDYKTLKSRMTYFLNHESDRERIIDAQYAFAMQHLEYEKGMKDVIEFVHQRLNQ